MKITKDIDNAKKFLNFIIKLLKARLVITGLKFPINFDLV